MRKIQKDYALEMRGISKEFPGVRACDDINLSVRKGEIHAIVGENGAGKTTLMKILCGAHTKDSGEILLRGNRVDITNPLDAQHLGIAIIYQEFNLALHLSSAANIFIGREPTRGLLKLINDREIHARAKSIFDQLGVDIDPNEAIRNLNVSQQQFTEIARALSMNPDILIMDEPTSSLPEREVKKLFQVIRRIQKDGVTILYISHCLDEVFEIADTITVLRDGKHIITKPKDKLTRDEVITYIVGSELKQVKREIKKGKEDHTLLEVRNLCQGERLKDISFQLKKGEILGIAGLLGAGRTELLSCIFGVNPKTSGTFLVEGEEVEINSPADAILKGFGYVPEDRKLQGLFLGLTTRSNISTTFLEYMMRGGLIKSKSEAVLVNHYIKSLDIKVYDPEQLAINLSGGNQQKVLLARWLSIEPKIILLDDPTRGIDVGARKAIHDLIFRLADKGMGVIFVSSELEEVMNVSDRILVMARGQITGEFSHQDVTKERIMSCATLSRQNHISYG